VTGLIVLAPLRVEAATIRGAVGEGRVVAAGMGPARACAAAEEARGLEATAVAVAGFCGAVDLALRPGDVVLATELRSDDGTRLCPGSTLLASPLRRLGLRVMTGVLWSGHRILGVAARERLRGDGVLAVDMESFWLADAAAGRPLAVVRVVVDEARRRLLHPRTLPAGLRAFRALRRAASALPEWAEETPSASSRAEDVEDGTPARESLRLHLSREVS
jgi:4-hydroxy-3-methylbut-2-en-1-yl diphosphate reductase